MVKRARVRTPEEVQKLRANYTNVEIDENKELTKKEKYFLYLIVYNHYEHYKAYDIAYPAPDNRERTEIYCQSKAYHILHKANVWKRYQEMEQELTEQLQEKALWTREQATEELIDVIKSNKDEKKRIDETCNAELDYIQLSLQNAKTINEKDKLFKESIKSRKQVRNTPVNNNAIISAVSELNKMYGYNSQEITVKRDEEFEIDKKLEKMSVEELTALLQKKENE